MDMPIGLNEPSVPSREAFFHRLKRHFNRAQRRRIKAAWDLSERCHAHEKRKSGQPYFDHPAAIAWYILDELQLYDEDVIILALLHDVLEIKQPRVHITRACLRTIFSEMIADGSHALARKRHSKNKKEPISRYVSRFSREWKTLLAKLVDRWHNMKTLRHMEPQSQQNTAFETRQYFIPLCDKLETMLPDEYRHIAAQLRHELECECAKYIPIAG